MDTVITFLLGGIVYTTMVVLTIQGLYRMGYRDGDRAARLELLKKDNG